MLLEVIGITKDNNKSSSVYFKPGTTYFTPSLKIHQIQDRDILYSISPPARVISSLQNGNTKHTDVFIANKWLKQLEDFCMDLAKDNNSMLKWLDSIDGSCPNEFEALHGSLTHALVLESVKFEIDKCQTNWGMIFQIAFLKTLNIA